jgi:hypothetical protein
MGARLFGEGRLTVSDPMTRWERLVWAASWVAPLAWLAVLVVFGVFVSWSALKARPDMFAWALGAVMLIGFAAHFLVHHHAMTAAHFSTDEKGKLRYKLWRGTGYGHWRELMRERRLHHYKGRSHSGERPRYD